MSNIVFLDAATVGDIPELEELAALGNYQSYPYTHASNVVERCQHADIILTNKVVISAEVMDQLPQLKMIFITATGMNNVDLSHAADKGIIVKNAVGYSTNSVAQHTFALILYLLHHVQYFDHYIKSGEYSKNDIFTHIPAEKPISEIKNKTFGIIGLGNIGRQSANLARAFGARVIYYSTSGKNYIMDFDRVDLDDLLKRSDIVSIHSPLNDKTYNLIGYAELQLMKKSAILVNTGRGGIINEADLAKALDEDLIAAAATDVFSQEPIPADNPLLSVKNKDKLVLSPHIAWTSSEARSTLMRKAVKAIKEYVPG